MPSSVHQIFKSVNIDRFQKVQWFEVPETKLKGGVYIVSLNGNPKTFESPYHDAPIDHSSLRVWLKRYPNIELDRVNPPNIDKITSRLQSFWFPDELVVYIGTTGTKLKKRITDYYGTPLGAPRPHSGGYWLKALSILEDLFVFYAGCKDPLQAENDMLEYFVNNVSEHSKSCLHDPENPFPFANLGYPKGNRKKH